METPLCIAIGRQYGSGGRRIGQLLSEKLGCAYYDKELLARVAKETGINGAFFERMDERTSTPVAVAQASGWSFSNWFGLAENLLSGESLFSMQCDTIRKIASEGPCVLVGRCANYILRDNPNLISVFITADESDRLARIQEVEQLDEKSARELLVKIDKSRASYYNYYTDMTWGASEFYDLCVNSSRLGVEATAELLADYILKRQRLL